MPTKTATVPSHLWLDERGRPWIDDKNIKVIEVIEALMSNGWNVQQYLEDYDHRLTAGQVHAALSYYYDHRTDMDAEIERDRQEYERLREESRKTPEHQRLMAKLEAYRKQHS
jgi:uncharacterized protein (DUF433 family)